MEDFNHPFEDVEFRAGHEDTLEWVERINARPFSHEKVARHLFTTKKEADIANTISKLTELQSDIDQVLRDKVTNNHAAFIQCSESIRRTGIELSELRDLVENTHEFIREVRAKGQIHSDSSMKKNDVIDIAKSLKESLSLERERDEENALTATYSTSRSLSIPKWLQESPNNLTKYIIEKNFSSAVNEILRVKGYKESSENNIDDTMERARVVRIFMTVDELGLVVARDLMQNLVKLPNSPIWGGSEQRRRLKLLISLGHYDFAAEAFSNASNDIIQTVLNDVEVSGDTQMYIMDLSKAFFASMQKVTVNFVTLFADYVDSPGVMSILVSWALDQVAALAGIICSQIELGAKELGALTVIHLKPKTVGAIAPSTARRSSVTFADNTAGSSDDTSERGRRDSFFAEHALSSAEVQELFGEDEAHAQSEGSVNSIVEQGKEIAAPSNYSVAASEDEYMDSLRLAFSPGPLTFVRHCLDVALTQSQQYASVALQGLDDLGWFMVPELKKAVMQYAEDLMTETISQVKQDSWSGVSTPFWEVHCMDNRSHHWGGSWHRPPKDAARTAENTTTGSSFIWFTLSLTHYLREVLVLLRAPTEHTEINEMLEDEHEDGGQGRALDGEGQPAGGTYDNDDDHGEDEDGDDGRQELCELEPVVVVCLLRLVVVYSLELERVALHSGDGRTPQQRTCIRNTMQALGSTTIPSLKTILLELFFDVRFSSLDGRVVSPSAALDRTSARMLQLASGIVISS